MNMEMMRMEQQKIVEYGELIVDPRCHIVILSGKEILLYPKEFEVLYFLSQYPGRVFSSEQIYEAVWHEIDNFAGTEVCYTICQIRKKLKRPEMIKTVRKYGYKFVG